MPRHGHMGPQGADEKAKDLKGTLKKLLHYMSVFKVQMLLIVILQSAEQHLRLSDQRFLEKQQRKLPTV